MSFAIQTNVSLAEYTTLKIGGRARFFVSAKSESEVIQALDFADTNDLKLFILGGGSNILIADEGFDGLVLQIALKGVSIVKEKGESVYVEAAAGENWDEFVAFCIGKNLQGVECLSGIPGLIGGSPVQNVGAYGQEVSETIVSVRCFDKSVSRIVELTNAECEFAYRASVFNSSEKNRYIVLAVIFALQLGGAPKIVYRDLQNYFVGQKPDLAETREAVLKIRAEKSMVLDAQDPNSKSAGSFFKNPIVSRENLAKIEKRARTIGFEAVPFFEIDENNVKIPAAWLIEKSGFDKGFEFGNVGISSRHTLAIINRGGATAQDVIGLKNFIQAKVQQRFAVELQPEPIFVGF
ncbi:MAG: UDP-N-acetylmuramate dehydrogenase [Pyrinomonadaceae bacterium]|nr:UDP-N-acetylmuramate dehydrogenase [Pyrinomonadaceae bacterium]